MKHIEWRDIHGLSWKALGQYIIFMPLIVIIVTMIVTLLTPVMSHIEGSLAPVITDFTATVEDNESGGSYLYGTFIKKRRCNLDRIEWYYNNGYLKTPLDVHFSRAIIRDRGVHRFEKLSLNAPPEIVKDHTVAHVYHHCHPFWETKTYLYP